MPALTIGNDLSLCFGLTLDGMGTPGSQGGSNAYALTVTPQNNSGASGTIQQLTTTG